MERKDSRLARHYYLLIAFSNHTAAAMAERSFAQFQLTLVNHVRLACTTQAWQTNNGLWWLAVYPQGVSLGIPNDPPKLTSSAQLDDVAQQLYQHLAQVEDFLCALAGWEVADLFMSDLDSGYQDLQLDVVLVAQSNHHWDGLVIPTSSWSGLNAPAGFEPFRP